MQERAHVCPAGQLMELLAGAGGVAPSRTLVLHVVAPLT